jgi:hypothetical protein
MAEATQSEFLMDNVPAQGARTTSFSNCQQLIMAAEPMQLLVMRLSPTGKEKYNHHCTDNRANQERVEN